jgi:hypothetical protein
MANAHPTAGLRDFRQRDAQILPVQRSLLLGHVVHTYPFMARSLLAEEGEKVIGLNVPRIADVK